MTGPTAAPVREPEPDSTDGREARSRRTRFAIVDGWLSLVTEGELTPTARSVAARAEVGLRTVFQHFEDLDALAVAGSERQLDRIRHLLGEVDPTTPFDQRVDEFVGGRAALLETVRPVRRAAALLEPRSPRLAELLRDADRALAEVAARAFATELGNEPPRDRATVARGLDAVTSFATWDHGRRQGHSVEQLSSMMRLALFRLLTSPPAHR